jgi:glutaminase
VRGVAVCEALSDEMELHFLRAPRASLSTVRERFTLQSVQSKRVRSDPERRLLMEGGHRAVIFRLQGDLAFAGMEVVSRRLAGEHDDVSTCVIDLSLVTAVDPPASRLLLELLQRFIAEGRTAVLVGLERHSRLRRFLEEARQTDGDLSVVHFDDLDLALEWCEDGLLAAAGIPMGPKGELPLEKHALLEHFDAHEIEALRARLVRREFAARKLVVSEGDPADELFLLVYGDLSVLTDTADGRLRRLATLSPGMGFGESFLVEGATRTAFVRADGPAACWVLSRAAFRRAVAAVPAIEGKLLQNLLRSTSRIIGRLTVEVLATDAGGIGGSA